MTAVKNIPARASIIEPPPNLPSFAAFAVSSPSEPIPVVAPEEQRLLSDAAVPARRESLARGRAAAHAALVPLGLDTGPILSGPSREPLWPEGAVGAITHTEGYGVAMAAPASETDGVGLDLEARRTVPELWERVPRPEERRWLGHVEEPEAALTALFSAKESVFKAFFPRIGSFFGFEAASLAPTVSGFVGRLVSGLDPDYPPERTFEITTQWFGGLVLTSIVLGKTVEPDQYRRPTNEMETLQ